MPFAFEDVSVEEGGVRLLDSVSVEVPAGGVTVVTGGSGAGKTTLLRLCNRLEVPTRGRVTFRGVDVAQLDPLALRRRVGMVFQRPALFAGTVRDNLRVAAGHDDEGRFFDALGSAGLAPGFLDRPADRLSGGEAQRVCLARTLATGPEVLLLDEPTSGLDIELTSSFEDVLRDLAAGGVAAIWVTHDLAQLRRIADQVMVLSRGRVVHAGAVEEIDQPSLAQLVAGAGDGG